MFEIFARGRPWGDMANTEVIFKVMSGSRLPIPKEAPNVVASLMQQLFARKPSERPNMAVVVQRLESLYLTSPEAEYVALSLSPPVNSTVGSDASLEEPESNEIAEFSSPRRQTASPRQQGSGSPRSANHQASSARSRSRNSNRRSQRKIDSLSSGMVNVLQPLGGPSGTDNVSFESPEAFSAIAETSNSKNGYGMSPGGAGVYALSMKTKKFLNVDALNTDYVELQLKWNCKVCGNTNEASVVHCVNCDAIRDSGENPNEHRASREQIDANLREEYAAIPGKEAAPHIFSLLLIPWQDNELELKVPMIDYAKISEDTGSECKILDEQIEQLKSRMRKVQGGETARELAVYRELLAIERLHKQTMESVASRPQHRVFYRTVLILLDQAFIGFAAGASGHVEVSALGGAKKVSMALKLLGTVVSLFAPIGGGIANGALVAVGEGVKQWSVARHRTYLQRIGSLVTDSERRELGVRIASSFVHLWGDSIAQLPEKAPEASVVARLLNRAKHTALKYDATSSQPPAALLAELVIACVLAKLETLVFVDEVDYVPISALSALLVSFTLDVPKGAVNLSASVKSPLKALLASAGSLGIPVMQGAGDAVLEIVSLFELLKVTCW